MWEHGTFKMELKGQTLIMKAMGSWNKETALRCHDDSIVLAKQISSKPWACFVDLTEWELGTPEIWEVVECINLWSNKNNQKFEVVVSDSSLAVVLLKDSHKVFDDIETMFCEDLNTAYAWLEERGFL